jgi:hypothetical protein
MLSLWLAVTFLDSLYMCTFPTVILNLVLLSFVAVFWIRILMILGLQDPDPFVRGTEPDPSIIKQNPKIRFPLFCDFFMTYYDLSLKTDVEFPQVVKRKKIRKKVNFC